MNRRDFLKLLATSPLGFFNDKTHPFKLPNILGLRPFRKFSTAHIIVHPSFPLYFQLTRQQFKKINKNPDYTQTFLNTHYQKTRYKNKPAQYRLRKAETLNETRFFTEAKDQLVILALGPPFQCNPYFEGLEKRTVCCAYDAYQRYIDSVSGKHFAYLYTNQSDSGIINYAKAKTLEKFLSEAGVKKIVLGGGRIGYCQTSFISSFIAHTGTENYDIKYASDISTIPMQHPKNIFSRLYWPKTPSKAHINFLNKIPEGNMEGTIDPAYFFDSSGKRNSNKYLPVYPVSYFDKTLDAKVAIIEEESFFQH